VRSQIRFFDRVSLVPQALLLFFFPLICGRMV
jgi:hypothetical protein